MKTVFPIVGLILLTLVFAGCKGNGPHAEKFGQEFAGHVFHKRYDDAYAMTALSFQKKVGLENFKAQVEEMRAAFAEGGPTLVKVSVPERNEGFMARTTMWRVAAQMSPPEAETPTIMVFHIVEQETEEPAFWVADLRFSTHMKELPKNDRWNQPKLKK